MSSKKKQENNVKITAISPIFEVCEVVPESKAEKRLVQIRDNFSKQLSMFVFNEMRDFNRSRVVIDYTECQQQISLITNINKLKVTTELITNQSYYASTTI